MASATRRSGATAGATRLILNHHRSSRSRHHLLPATSFITNAAPPQLKQHLLGFGVRSFLSGGVGRETEDLFSRRQGGSLSHESREGSKCWEQQDQRRHYGGSSGSHSSVSKKSETDGEEIARQMIGYAATNRINAATQVEVARVLEQGYNFLLSQGPLMANAAAKVLLTLATLHVDRGKLLDAVDVLQQAANLEGASVEVHVSAREALVGVLLRIHKDSDALSEAQSTIDQVNGTEGLPSKLAKELQFRAAATVQFVEHTSGSKTSGNFHDVSDLTSWLDHKEANPDGVAAALLGVAECAHIRGHFSQAKGYYEKASALARTRFKREPFGSAAGAMTVEEVLVGTLAGLGQVAAHLGDFDEAEKHLTMALVNAEQINGDKHPRVGAVLACLADVYSQRGAVKGDLVLAEGLYRKATDLLRAPPVDYPASGKDFDLSDVMAISRARYAALLSQANKRESEAQKLYAWATAAWKGPRSLTDVLIQEASTQPTASTVKNGAINNAYTGRYVVIDVRLGRVLYSPSNL